MKKFFQSSEILWFFCQKEYGIIIKIENDKFAYMLGPIAFILGGIASLVSLWAYFEKVIGI